MQAKGNDIKIKRMRLMMICVQGRNCPESLILKVISIEIR